MLTPPCRLAFGFWVRCKTEMCSATLSAQMTGALLGAWVARDVLGRWAMQMRLADLRPGANVTRAEAFVAELIVTLVLTSVLYALVSHQRLLHLTPAVMTPVTGVLVCAAGNISGAGMNPARWFGPACVVSDWALPSVYALGPIAGVALAVVLRRVGPLRPPTAPHWQAIPRPLLSVCLPP